MTTPPLRRWQIDALTKWIARRRGVASVVTGAGKTRLALACVAEQRKSSPDMQVLVIVPTLALLDQWLSVFHADPVFEREQVATHSDGKLGPTTAPYNLATANTARTATKALSSRGSWMLVADECHRYASPANRAAIDAPWGASLGLSATPSRDYDTWFEEYVEPVIGPVFYEYGYDEAIHDGVLVPFRLSNFRVPLTSREEERYASLTRRIAALISGRDGASDEALKRATLARAKLAQDARARVPAACAIMERHRGERALLFHEQVAAAEDITRRLTVAGHRAVIYHSSMTPSTRLKSLLMFRTGQADILVSCRALDEGLDVPDATFGLICSSTASTRQRIQRLGRLLRPSPGKASAEIGTIYATGAERERLGDEERQLDGLASVSWHEVLFS